MCAWQWTFAAADEMTPKLVMFCHDVNIGIDSLALCLFNSGLSTCIQMVLSNQQYVHTPPNVLKECIFTT